MMQFFTYAFVLCNAHRPNIDSEINRIRHFIKIPLKNKRIEFTDMSGIFRDKPVVSVIADFQKYLIIKCI